MNSRCTVGFSFSLAEKVTGQQFRMEMSDMKLVGEKKTTFINIIACGGRHMVLIFSNCLVRIMFFKLGYSLVYIWGNGPKLIKKNFFVSVTLCICE